MLPGAKALLAPSGRNAHSYWKDIYCGKRDRGLSQLCTTLPHSAGCSWAAVLAFPELSTAPGTKGYCGDAPVSSKRDRQLSQLCTPLPELSWLSTGRSSITTGALHRLRFRAAHAAGMDSQATRNDHR